MHNFFMIDVTALLHNIFFFENAKK